MQRAPLLLILLLLLRLVLLLGSRIVAQPCAQLLISPLSVYSLSLAMIEVMLYRDMFTISILRGFVLFCLLGVSL